MTDAVREPYKEDPEALKSRIMNNTPFSKEETLKIYESYFWKIPRRLSVVLIKYRLFEKSVIDVGCGFGHCLIRFGKGSVGLDSLETNVRFGRSIGLNVIKCNVEDTIPLENGKYDAAFASHILEHVVSPHNLLVNLSNKLKDAGLIICVLSILPRWKLFRFVINDIMKYRGAFSSTHYYQFTADTARYLVERGGFEIIDSFNTWPANMTLNKIMILDGNLINYVIVGRKSTTIINKMLAGRGKNLGKGSKID